MDNKVIVSLLLGAFVVVSCGEKNENKNEEGVETALVAEPNQVNVSILRKTDFKHELISNGKVVAANSADLYFESTESVKSINVKNGDYVKKGDVIAVLDRFKLQNRLKQAKDEHERSYLELQDVLIGQGYSPDDTIQVPKSILKLAKIKSGYDRSKIQYDLAKHELDNATLIAPFDGQIANLFVKEMNQPKAGEAFCRIIGSKGLEIDFQVLESELPLLRKGNKVGIIPYAYNDKVVQGVVSEVNPLVDAAGMVKVKAAVANNTELFEGMNVKVKVQRAVGEALVVPKDAIVLRSGRKVLFRLTKNKAYWVYVDTELENSDSYTLVENKDIAEGDTIVVSGTLNLAHESPVLVKEIL